MSYVGQDPRYMQRHVSLTPAQLTKQTATQPTAHEAAMRELRRHVAKRPKEALYPQATDSEGEGDERAVPVPQRSQHSAASAAAADSSQRSQALRRAERTAQAELDEQQARFTELEAEFHQVQNQIFSKTVHDLHRTEIIASQHPGAPVDADGV